ncbi:hypothetical protein [Streptomyces apricus]|uniref:Uncharacterized protein n=1 Tax=Streptomyces apricus TaxID=1828112 RepID=A0A5B0BFF7_9ACTN|nr:hypothetical protein [Streptomyces apricus]KAA0940251.1 hypothetical protein FGF04_10440 [Streptomyces apricus]
MPLPHFVLSRSQQHMLAEALLRPLWDPAGGEAAEAELLARGLDPEEIRAEAPDLIFLKLLVRDGGLLSVTGLGAAVHYRTAFEAAEERLAATVRLMESAEGVPPRLARAVRRLAHGSVRFDEAIEELEHTD